MALPASRNTTYSPNAQIKSEDLNAIQDSIIAAHGEHTLPFNPRVGFWDLGGASFDLGATVLCVKSIASGTGYVPIPGLRQGDRIKSATITIFGDGAADLNWAVVKITAADPTTPSILAPGSDTVVTNPTNAWTASTHTVTAYTLAAGELLLVRIQPNAAGITFGTMRVTYDRPTH